MSEQVEQKIVIVRDWMRKKAEHGGSVAVDNAWQDICALARRAEEIDGRGGWREVVSMLRHSEAALQERVTRLEGALSLEHPGWSAADRLKRAADTVMGQTGRDSIRASTADAHAVTALLLKIRALLPREAPKEGRDGDESNAPAMTRRD